MSYPLYRALRIVLGFLSLLMVTGGVLLIFSSKPLIVRLFLHPPEAEISTLLLFTLKEMGGFALMLSVMLFLAFRDPVRNVAIIDAVMLRTLRAGGYAAHLFLYARYPENLSRASGLGAVSHTTWARGSPLLPAATGDALETCGAFLNNAGALGHEFCMARYRILRGVGRGFVRIFGSRILRGVAGFLALWCG